MSEKKKLKIALFCATEFHTPPQNMKDIYAPLWLLSYLTEELTARGHKVSLFAATGSKTKAKLISNNLPALSQSKKFAKFYKQQNKNEVIWQNDSLMLSKLYQMANKGAFDIILIHLIGLRSLGFAAACSTPTVFVLNDPLDDFRQLLFSEYKQRYPQIHFLGISKTQVAPNPKLFSDIIYHGVKMENFPFEEKPGKYLITAGRLLAKKGIYEAIQATKQAKAKLIILGRHRNEPYWQNKIKPYLGKDIIYKGVVPYSQVPLLLSKAKAFLFPIKWPEPFGMVMIEAMACGTPVIAFPQGAAQEVIKHNKTGFLVKPQKNKQGEPNIAGLVQAIKKTIQIDRADCRKYVEQSFSIQRMVDDYEKLFYKILD